MEMLDRRGKIEVDDNLRGWKQVDDHGRKRNRMKAEGTWFWGQKLRRNARVSVVANECGAEGRLGKKG